MEGLMEIVAIKASLNLGLSDELKSAFPNIIPLYDLITTLRLRLSLVFNG